MRLCRGLADVGFFFEGFFLVALFFILILVAFFLEAVNAELVIDRSAILAESGTTFFTSI